MKKTGRHFQFRKILSLLLAAVVMTSLLAVEGFAAGGSQSQVYRFENGELVLINEDGGNGLLKYADEISSFKEKAFMPASAPLLHKLVETYSTYLFLMPMYVGMIYGTTGQFVLGYSADNGNNWTVYPDTLSHTSQPITVSGLIPNTDYILRFAALTYRNELTHLGDVRVHTGMPDLKIKKVTAEAIKVKHRKMRRRTPNYGYLLSGYWYYYTYKVKITVQLKKKPGTPGIFINGIWVPGNKKKYKVTIPILYSTFPRNKSPRNRVKYTVSVYSGFDPSDGGYGGFSPLWQKTKKLK